MGQVWEVRHTTYEHIVLSKQMDLGQWMCLIFSHNAKLLFVIFSITFQKKNPVSRNRSSKNNLISSQTIFLDPFHQIPI